MRPDPRACFGASLVSVGALVLARIARRRGSTDVDCAASAGPRSLRDGQEPLDDDLEID